MTDKVLIPEYLINYQVHKLAECINEQYADLEITPLIVLKGGVQFATDMLKYVTRPCELHYISASSYEEGICSRGIVLFSRFNFDQLRGKHVLIIDDLLDTGLTMRTLKTYVEKVNPESVKVCCLLNKIGRREVAIQSNFPVIDIDNIWVYGYGMDLKGMYRNIPEIRVWEK